MQKVVYLKGYSYVAILKPNSQWIFSVKNSKSNYFDILVL